MDKLKDLLKQHTDTKIAIYGLGTETERFLAEYGKDIVVAGLLDGFREDGEQYGYPILPIRKVIEEGVGLVIVVARPGSCKAIAKRIGNICRNSGVALFDVRGKDLLARKAARYDLTDVQGELKEVLLEKIRSAEVVSFDLFDTLIMRKVYSYTDVFDLVDLELKRNGIAIPDLARRRLSAEKELSKEVAPTLEDIYGEVLQQVGGSFLSAEELAEIEWSIDFRTMLPRTAVCEVYREAVGSGKKVIITTDSYYRKDKIERILSRFGIDGYDSVFVSCEYGTSKTLELYDRMTSQYSNGPLLHIGDDGAADISEALKRGIDTYRIYSGADLFDALGGLGTEGYIDTLADRLKCGLFISHIFNDPFRFETEERKVNITSAKEIGYLLCGAIISDFTLWMKEQVKAEEFEQILFCARDGYLPGRLYRKADTQTRSIYFLASRAAAIRAGMENEEDIAYVDSMKYFGTPEEALKTRFGIVLPEVEADTKQHLILKKAEEQRRNYRKYINKLGITDGKMAMFDFVAKGTTQMYLERVFGRKMKGFYFLQLEPEFMADKGLSIEPFYSDSEKNRSAVFDNYYILETMLTSPYPQAEGFDEDGDPVFAKETRSKKDIRCFEQAQKGITEYFEDYISLLPEDARMKNIKLDEAFLSLVNKVEIVDEDFMSLTVEDPFFGRMTDIKDVIG